MVALKRTDDNPQMEIFHVTPEMAGEWLKTNVKNRRWSTERSEQMSTAMLAGDWELSPDPITFDHDGRLTNGQHRLHAVVKSNTTQQFFVVRGMSPSSLYITDTGRSRSFADFLAIANEPSYRDLAAAVGMYYRWDQKQTFRLLAQEVRPSVQDLFRTLERHPGIRQSMLPARRVHAHLTGGVGLWSAIHYVLNQIDETDAAFFFEVVANGAGLANGDPMLALRNRLLVTGRMDMRLKDYEWAAMVIKAWNAYREGRSLQVMSWRAGGAHPEPYPVPL